MKNILTIALAFLGLALVADTAMAAETAEAAAATGLGLKGIGGGLAAGLGAVGAGIGIGQIGGALFRPSPVNPKWPARLAPT